MTSLTCSLCGSQLDNQPGMDTHLQQHYRPGESVRRDLDTLVRERLKNGNTVRTIAPAVARQTGLSREKAYELTVQIASQNQYWAERANRVERASRDDVVQNTSGLRLRPVIWLVLAVVLFFWGGLVTCLLG